MKIRIRQNTLRLRVTQTELKSLLKGDAVLSTIHFPGSTKLNYGLIPSQNKTTSVIYEDNEIQIHLGILDRETMQDEKSVGVQSIHQAGDHQLDLLVEKDFTCLHPRNGDDTDTFPNPNKKEIADGES